LQEKEKENLKRPERPERPERERVL